ncbi:hypothetical protein JKP88DRAFT_347013 [Tribonema minus]|uniref:Uncharacterized protein n=1 Tax=Tribonema minus TaxID=303371 RepID=A0A835YPU0_9STRA|nr:hypothetical protein JKP88DRAFT_347013 [Tribonema minus]
MVVQQQEALNESLSDVEPIVVAKKHIVQMAAQHTSCAGCVAAVKALITQPLSNLRMLAAIMDDDGSNLVLKEAYQNDERRLSLLLEAFPLNAVLKKVQPPSSSLRCPLHRRSACSTPLTASNSNSNNNNNNSNSGHGSSANNSSSTVAALDGWEWMDAWDRLPQQDRCKVATIDAAGLESALHVATSNHRFCADCKHNVVIAFDLLTQRYDASGIDNAEEYNAELFRPFIGRMRPMEGGAEGSGGAGRAGRQMLVCAVEDVEELICWHEDFDSQQEYASSGQRHAATLEHGQRELRSIVGSMLLSQLRAAWTAHNARAQAEQYLFGLAVDAIRTALRSAEDDLMGDGLLEGDGADGAESRRARKTASKRRKERRAKAKAKKDEAPIAPSKPKDGKAARKGQPAAAALPLPPPRIDTGADAAPPAAAHAGAGGSTPCAAANCTCEAGAAAAKHTNGSGGGGNGAAAACNGGGGAVALFGSGGGGGSGSVGGLSLMDQLEDSSDEDALDPDLLREMEALRAGLDVCDRASLRATLHQNFREFLSAQRG